MVHELYCPDIRIRTWTIILESKIHNLRPMIEVSKALSYLLADTTIYVMNSFNLGNRLKCSSMHLRRSPCRCVTTSEKHLKLGLSQRHVNLLMSSRLASNGTLLGSSQEIELAGNVRESSFRGITVF